MNDSTLTISKIAVYDLNGSYTTYNGKKMFSPKDMITFDMHNTHTKYEVESLATIAGAGVTPVTVNETVNAASGPLLTITKSVSPVPVTENGTLTFFISRSHTRSE